MRPLISLQLYTVREQLAKDELGTLEKISAIGYEGIEAGFNTSEAMLNKCTELSLEITAVFCGVDNLTNDLDAVANFTKRIGVEFVVLGWIGAEYRKDRASWIQTAQLLSGFGARLREQGLRLLYHNHDFEFEQFDGEYGLDILLSNVPEENMGVELDTYWIKKGGADPVEFIQKYASRLPLLHCKDISESGEFMEVGEGILDWPSIFAAAEKAGVSVYAVEQDKCSGDPFDSIKVSLDNLRKMGKF